MLRRNILIFHQAALGDFIVTWPLALTLGRVFAQSRVFFVTSTEKGRLAEKLLGVEWADSEAFAPLWGTPERLPEASQRLLGGAAGIFSFIARPGDAWDTNIRQIAGIAPEYLQTAEVPQSAEFAGLHVAQQIAAQLLSPKLKEAAGQMVESVNARGISSRPKDLQNVLIHPGSGSERKNWPAGRFLSLCQTLCQAGRQVTVVLGEVERERWGEAGCGAFAGHARVVHPANLLELAALMQSHGVAICNDSGPGHLAGILGCRTISLFGGGDPARWRPLGPDVHVLHKPAIEEIQVQDVVELLNC